MAVLTDAVEIFESAPYAISNQLATMNPPGAQPKPILLSPSGGTRG